MCLDFNGQVQLAEQYYDKLSNLIREDSFMINDMNKLLCLDAKIQTMQQKITEILKNEPDKFKAALLLIEQIKEGNINISHYKDIIQAHFKDYPELQNRIQQTLRISSFFPYLSSDQSQQTNTQQKKMEKLIVKQKESKESNSQSKPPLKKKDQEPHLSNNNNSNLINHDNSQEVDLEQKNCIEHYFACQINHIFISFQNLHFFYMKNDLLFFDRLRQRVKTQFENTVEFNTFYQQFIKALHLYQESIISQNELLSQLQQHIWLDKEFVDEFKAILSYRSAARRKFTPLFKPLKDTDFTNSNRVTHSYVEVHSGYATHLSNSNSINLNHKWVSVPFGSEDYSFVIMRKNTFEEQLFKSEDERYEIDLTLQQMRLAMKLLEQITKGQLSQIKKLISIKIIHLLYRNDHDEVIQHLQSNPEHTAKIILRSLNQRYNEINEIRNTKARSIWEQVSQFNFHRSLDHRSFYFKKNDKVFTAPARFLKESEERINSLRNYFTKYQCKAITQNHSLEMFSQYYNTLDQLTSIMPLLPPENKIALIPNKENIKKFPIYALWFGNEEIMSECVKYALHYIQIMTGSSLQEKKAASKLLIQLVQSLLNIKIQHVDLNEFLINELQLKGEVQEIQSKIYEQIYTYIGNDNEEAKPSAANKKAKAAESEQSEQVDDHQEFKQNSGNNPQDVQVNKFPISQFENQRETQVNLQFLPKLDYSLYVNTGIYVAIRYLYAFYQRMELAKEESNVFENNKKTIGIMKMKFIPQGLLKSKNKRFLKNDIFYLSPPYSYRYERKILSLRIIQAAYSGITYIQKNVIQKSFLFSTLEKLLHDLCKQLVSICQEFVTRHIIAEQINCKAENHEQIFDNLFDVLTKVACGNQQKEQICIPQLYRCQIVQNEVNIINCYVQEQILASLCLAILEKGSEKVQDKQLYRLTFNDQDKTMYIQFIPGYTHVNDKNQLYKSCAFTWNYTQQLYPLPKKTSRLYLQRNLKRSSVYIENNIEWGVGNNQQLNIINSMDFRSREDILIALTRRESVQFSLLMRNYMKSRTVHDKMKKKVDQETNEKRKE